MKRALVCGAGGFIGTHLVRRLAREGYWVRGVDLRLPEFSRTAAHDFVLGDLRDPGLCASLFDCEFQEVYQLAANMGGAGYLFTGQHDAEVLHASALINLNVLDARRRGGSGRVFFSSSACIYPVHTQTHADQPDCAEERAYPADPDSEYGWEKLFAERLYQAFQRNHGLEVRIARLHNVFGPEGAWRNGREKAPAALCRKVAQAAPGGAIEIWGDGRQTRSFLFIDECLEGIRRLMASDFTGPVNVGSDEMISIRDLALLIMRIAGKELRLETIPGPQGVRGRNSDNRLIEARLGWRPTQPLEVGMRATYAWIAEQVARAESAQST